MDKREAILAAALKLFAERGFYGTPVPLIAEEAQVGAGTIYRYFSNKNSLVNELYRHWKSALSQALTEGLPEDLPLRSLFREVLKNWIRFAITNRDAFVFLESHHHGSYLDEESIRLTDRIHNNYLQIFEQGQRDQIVKQVEPPTADGGGLRNGHPNDEGLLGRISGYNTRKHYPGGRNLLGGHSGLRALLSRCGRLWLKMAASSAKWVQRSSTTLPFLASLPL